LYHPLRVFNKRGGDFSEADTDLIKTLALIAASAIESAQLYQELKLTFSSFIETLSTTLDARDYITAGHSRRVTLYALEIGRQMKLPRHDLEILRYAALLHDIGKLGVPELVLFKDRRLSEEEYEIIKRHAHLTKSILSKIHFQRQYREIPDIASSHHEKINGHGYPLGISGDKIPLGGKILAVADVFDALTSRRQYRDRMEIEKVVHIIDKETGSSFEPFVVYNFKHITLDRLIKVLEYGHRSELSEHDIDILRDYSLKEIVEIRLKNRKTKEEKLAESTFMRYYLRKYRGVDQI